MCNNTSNRDTELWTSSTYYLEQPESSSITHSSSEEGDRKSNGSMTGITYPGKHDVMLGRGGESNKHVSILFGDHAELHSFLFLFLLTLSLSLLLLLLLFFQIGNIKFRKFIEKYKRVYQNATRSEKAEIALEVVYTWRELNPPGRFLTKTYPNQGEKCLWHDVGDEQARKKASKSLGERKNFDPTNLSSSEPSSISNSSDDDELMLMRFSQKKRSLGFIVPPSSKRQRSSDCSSTAATSSSASSSSSAGSSCSNNDIAVSCPTWIPDDWSDNESQTGKDSNSNSKEAIASDILPVTAANYDGSQTMMNNDNWWQNFDEVKSIFTTTTQPQKTTSTTHIESQQWRQEIMKDEIPIKTVSSASTTFPVFSNNAAQNALICAGVNIPTAAELVACNIFD